jgi:hypothetical protein
VNGKYTEWAAWSECSKTCGDGKKRRKRDCTAPKADFGGKTCAEQKLGDTSEMTSCNLGPCPSKYTIVPTSSCMRNSSDILVGVVV